MSIYVTGDTHGYLAQILQIEQYAGAELKEGDYLLICGDFGFVFLCDEFEKEALFELSCRPYTILFVDGNHENFPVLFRYPERTWNGGRIHRIRDNIFHLMRGQVFTIEGKTFFTFGGAASIDKKERTPGLSWWKEEIPGEEEYREAVKNLKQHHMRVDYIVTHTMPIHLIQAYLKGRTPALLPDRDLTAFLETIWRGVSFSHWYCGHWHDDTDELDPRFSMLWYDVKKIPEDTDLE